VSAASREDFFRANPQGLALAGSPADQNFLRKQPKTSLINCQKILINGEKKSLRFGLCNSDAQIASAFKRGEAAE
jgi:hypothetical protein